MRLEDRFPSGDARVDPGLVEDPSEEPAGHRREREDVAEGAAGVVDRSQVGVAEDGVAQDLGLYFDWDLWQGHEGR